MSIGVDYLRKQGWKQSSIDLLGHIMLFLAIALIFVGIILLTPSYEINLKMVP